MNETWKVFWITVATTSFAAVILLLIMPHKADAAVRCAPHKAMIELLAKRFSEIPKGVGLVGKKSVMQLFVSESGSWTILITAHTGRSCIAAAGENYEDMPAIVPGQDS